MEKIMRKKSHQLLASGYIIRDNEVLWLHRSRPLQIWAPPRGHLEPGEPPKEGLKREIIEDFEKACWFFHCLNEEQH